MPHDDDNDLDEDGLTRSESYRMMGYCPHGAAVDDECDQCCGGPDGWPTDIWGD